MKCPSVAAALVALGLAACGESGEKAVGAVQAATKAAGETLLELAERIDPEQLTPEAARQQAQELVNRAAQELDRVRDSAAVERLGQELEAVLDKCAELWRSLAVELDLSALQAKLSELVERFRDDPRVQRVLQNLQDKLQSLRR